ncbi:MAG: transporter substrate-binding domain-containing protein, partial [Fibrobacterales bacterium]
MPFQFSDENSAPSGVVVDLWKFWSEKSGTPIRFIATEWNESLQQVKTGMADVHAGLFYNKSRAQYLEYSGALVNTETHIFLHNSLVHIDSIDQLTDVFIGVLSGDFAESYLKEQLPNGRFVVYPNYEALFEDARKGKVRAFAVDTPTGMFYLKKYSILDHFVAKDNLRLYDNDWRIAVSKKQVGLLPKIERGMLLISQEEKDSIFFLWSQLLSSDTLEKIEARIEKKSRRELFNKPVYSGHKTSKYSDLNLTEEEEKYLRNNQVIRMGADPVFPPFDFVDSLGVHSGLAADYFDLLGKKIGIRFQYMPIKSWSAVLDSVQSGGVDIVSLCHKTDKRKEYLHFTNTILETPRVVIGKKGTKPVQSLDEIPGKRVAMVEGYSIIELSKKKFPNLTIVEYKSPLAALQAVSNGDIDYLAITLGVALHLINKEYLANLSVVGKTGLTNDHFHFGISKEHPQLVSIINKAMGKISFGERRAMQNKWIDMTYFDMRAEQVFPWKSLLLGLLGIAFVIGIIFVVAQKSGLGKTFNFFDSKNTVRYLLPVVLGFVIVVLAGAWYAFSSMEERLRYKTGLNLVSVNNSINKSLELWTEHNQGEVHALITDNEFTEAVQNISTQSIERDSLLISKELEQLRRIYRRYNKVIQAEGFFVVSTNGINLASDYDENIGENNLINEQRPDLIQEAISGKSIYVPPLFSDIPQADAFGRIVSRAPTIFFAEPLRDKNDSIIAIVTLRFSPSKEFGAITLASEIGETGESYVFDTHARLLTSSRFKNSIQPLLKLISKIDSGMSMRIKDPGGSIPDGYIPSQEVTEWPLTNMAERALAGNNGINIAGYRDYRGKRVLGAWSWIRDLGIGIATEIDEEEALESYHEIRDQMRLLLFG